MNTGLHAGLPPLKSRRLTLATDLDGTFLGGTDSDRAELYGWIENNRDSIGLIFVTGRDPEFILRMCSHEGLPWPDLVVGDVGTTIARVDREERRVEPIAAHLFIFYLGMMSMVTPPVGIGAFFAASIAKAPPMATAFESMRFGWTAYIIPFLFVFSPALLLIGNPVDSLIAVATAVLGVYAISAAFIGWLHGPAGLVRRSAIVAAGIALLLPPGIGGELTLWVNGAGLIVLAILWTFGRGASKHEIAEAAGQ